MWQTLWMQAVAEDAPDDVVRLATMVGIVRATGARRAELTRMTLGDVKPRKGEVMVRRTKFRQITTKPMDEDLHRVVREWGKRRRKLLKELAGGEHDALFVTCHHTMWRGVSGMVTKQVGLPLSEQGVLLAWRRWAQRMNIENAGRPGWEPLPHRFEEIRQAWMRP
ncbi:tyrosine-type recombinase/integrase [Streptomyces sp. NPDC055105]|uniref:tyrosine-type recombinase/integrase n=1 Tax=Streptomyces sp. NPDC055105 TaxID=3365719 RepID=UPI0037D864DD